MASRRARDSPTAAGYVALPRATSVPARLPSAAQRARAHVQEVVLDLERRGRPSGPVSSSASTVRRSASPAIAPSASDAPNSAPVLRSWMSRTRRAEGFLPSAATSSAWPPTSCIAPAACASRRTASATRAARHAVVGEPRRSPRTRTPAARRRPARPAPRRTFVRREPAAAVVIVVHRGQVVVRPARTRARTHRDGSRQRALPRAAHRARRRPAPAAAARACRARARRSGAPGPTRPGPSRALAQRATPGACSNATRMGSSAATNADAGSGSRTPWRGEPAANGSRRAWAIRAAARPRAVCARGQFHRFRGRGGALLLHQPLDPLLGLVQHLLQPARELDALFITCDRVLERQLARTPAPPRSSPAASCSDSKSSGASACGVALGARHQWPPCESPAERPRPVHLLHCGSSSRSRRPRRFANSSVTCAPADSERGAAHKPALRGRCTRA